MSYPTDRVALFNRDMEPLPELSPDEVFSRVRTEEINGEHSLVITTTRRLQEGWRALTVDGTGKWREWVVTEIDEEHTSGRHALGTYHLVWSLQYDLTLSYYHDTDYAVSIGIGELCTARTAAEHVLTGVKGWTVGTCDAADIVPDEPIYASDSNKTANSNKINSRGRVKGNPDATGCVFIRESAWSKLSKLVKAALYEVDSEIVVSSFGTVSERRLCLRAHVGNEEALRRFDWNEDLISIKRTPDPGPYYCRVVPLGKTQEEYADDDMTKFEWPLDITEETGTAANPGPYWIQDDEAAEAFRIRVADGSYVYPTVAVEYRDEDDPELLLNAAMADLHNHTRPGVIYEANVLQFEQAGMNVHGVALGDEVHVVDYGFNPDSGLRISGRVAKIEVNELSPDTDTQLTIGYLRENMADAVVSMGDSLAAMESRNEGIAQQVATMNTARYIDELLDRINREINATGGYSYLVPGEGIITYDKAVSDPLVGSEANQVVQIKGGSIRIAARHKDPFSGIDDWEWRTVFTADGINADLVTAAKIVSGYIGNATNSNYWNLDTGEFVLRTLWYTKNTTANLIKYYVESKMGTVYVADADAVWHLAGGITTSSHYLSGFRTSNITYTPNDGTTTTDSYVILLPYGSNYRDTGSYGWNSIVSSHTLAIWAGWDDPAGQSLIFMNPHRIDLSPNGDRMMYTGSQDPTRLTLTSEDAYLYGTNVYINGTTKITGTLDAGATSIIGTFSASASRNSTPYLSPVITSANYIRGICTPFLCAGSPTDTSGYNSLPGNGSVNARNVYVGSTDNAGIVSIHGDLSVYGGKMYCDGMVSSNIKSRLVDTKDYEDRLLFCYETSAPMFGDIGSGVIDSDGYAYVSIDDIFTETAHTDYAYQVFLQKCGPGDLWVAEKHPDYFVVQGTPNLAFDWELKAHQLNLENLRLDSLSQYEAPNEGMREGNEMTDDIIDGGAEDIPDVEETASLIEDLYNDPVAELEQMYDEILAA